MPERQLEYAENPGVDGGWSYTKAEGARSISTRP